MVLPLDVNDVDTLTATIATLEKAGGTITQVLATGQAWLIVYQGGQKPAKASAAKKAEVR
jgi:hypothetical protein